MVEWLMVEWMYGCIAMWLYGYMVKWLMADG